MAPTSVTRREDKKRAQDKQRPQFESSSETNQNTCKPILTAGHRKERTDHKRNGRDIPVCKGMNDNEGARGHEHRIPCTVSSELENHVDRTDPNAGKHERGDSEIPTGIRYAEELTNWIRDS